MAADSGHRSLFGEILDWMLAPLLVIWPISVALTWLVAQGIANKPYDRELGEMARSLGLQVATEQPRNSARSRYALAPEAAALLRADETDTVYYQVLGLRGEFLSGDRALPVPEADPPVVPWELHFRDDEVNNESVRVAYLWVAPEGMAGSSQTMLVQVAETLGKRARLTNEIIKGVILPQFVILPLAVLLVWLALARGIQPLNQLEQRIRARSPDDLSPLDDHAVPLEVAPLVSSVNDLLTRLNESLATQKRFLADAAHQLKTPLAGLRMQADLAQREGTSTEELKRSLQQIGRSSIRATHTVNQLLALARAEGSGVGIARQPCDLAELAIEVVRDSVPRALEKHIDLGYDGALPESPGVWLDGNPTLLKELVRNLVDNAINYTPSTPAKPGVVTARVLADTFGHVLMLQVEDSGPGVPEAERELVFQPFYRALGSEADGSGLGLPIVMEIAAKHGAEVLLEDAHPGQQPPGARFSVRFPARTEDAG